jgi:adenylate cyclase
MLESMKTGVMTTDARGCIIKANSAALALFNAEDSPESLIGQLAPDFFLDANSWIATSVAQALQERVSDDARDVMLYVEDANKHSKGISVNVTTQPLRAVEDGKNGCLLVVEDITTEKRLRSTMSRYMPKELADQLLDDGEQALGGTLQKATILFSDIRAFTGFSERNGPQETVRMLNEYFGVMYEKITGNDGLLDKYIGDAMMAVFGVPFTCDRDADNAVAAAIDMMNCLTDFNHVRMKAGKESISIGIGVSTGEVVSGNIGSSKRMDYTVIGDGVNLAARLESATKVYRTPILVSEQTVKAMTTPLEFREIDRIRAKGQMEPVAIFEVLDGLKDTDKLGVLDQLDRFGEAMGLYRGMQWNDASTLFSEVHSACPSDHVTQVYLERCEYLATAPPSMDWDGIWTMNTK